MDVHLRYQESLDFLYSFIDYSLTRSFRYTPDKFNLDRMVDLMEKLGNPHKRYPVIHVAGTKGKGSVSAMCANILKQAGYKVGFYTSPHLQEYTERIKINGQQISQGDFVEMVDEIRPFASQIEHITTFELTTAISFLFFARQKVDITVLEVGLGGRLDATNIVDPLVSVITSLSYDHMQVLGNTLTKIAGEKAGIIKPGRPVVVAPQKDEAMAVIERIANECDSPLYRVGRDYQFEAVAHSQEKQTFSVWNPDDRIGCQPSANSSSEPVQFTIPLLGLHQVENAVTAYAALQVACKEGLKLNRAAIKSGFATVFWPGRFEILNKAPALIVDSAHNPDSARRLCQAVDDYFPGKDVTLIFGASEDKDIAGMYAELLPRVSNLIVTQSVHPRAMNTDMLVQIANKYNCKTTVSIPVERALETAFTLAGPEFSYFS